MQENEETFYGIYLDSFFKKIFADSNDTKLLKSLISIILNEEIESVTIMSPEVVGDKISVKKSYLDLLVELKNKTKINIKINSNPQNYTTNRNLIYLFKVMGLIGAKDKKHYEILKKEKGIVKEIMEKAIKYVTDKDLVEVLDYEKMRDNREIAAKELGFNTGFNDGFNDGVEYNTQVIVKNMLKEKTDIAFISKVTGLSKEEIEKLKYKLK